jgi:hypothetical protein
LKVPGKDVFLTHAFVIEESICRLGVRPVLTSHRNALAGAIGELLKEFPESFPQPFILELTSSKLPVDPAPIALVLTPRSHASAYLAQHVDGDKGYLRTQKIFQLLAINS